MTLYSDVTSNNPTLLERMDTTQATTCWIRYSSKIQCAFTTNNGGNSISSLTSKDHTLTLIQAVAAELNVPIDFSLSLISNFFMPYLQDTLCRTMI